ncbi:hypothetical protein Nepgr_005400 [Nepenthes gracilis]|uniref:Tac7077 n=1 Tax=Nepenthes gracilis TaxID=150966 RepID=A0AAD3S3G3_NEPGR|nr:hypothetical protein Nepgr_005400 [Nepenthes gracilis]
MIKRKSLRSMAVMLVGNGMACLLHDDQVPSFARISILANSKSSRISGNIGLNLRGCIHSQEKLHSNLKRSENCFLNVDDGFQNTRVFEVSQQPLLELRRLQQENRRGGGLADGRSSSQTQRGRSIGLPNNESLPDKIAVAVDVDEVLGNFVTALNSFIADRYSLNHSVSEYHVYEFFKIWNCSRGEADIRVHEFFKTSYFENGIHPIPGSQRALQKLSQFCNLSVVTSRQNAIKDQTVEWIKKHYPGIFQGIHFGNHFALDGESRSKSDICRSMGVKVLIDDNPRYAIECAEVGIRVLLFDYQNSYPWCKTLSVHQHPLVTKVHNWEEVERHLVSCIFS